MTNKIQTAICRLYAEMGYEAICENFSSTWEMDVACLSKSGMLHEFEVKISRSDFLSDKKNKIKKFTCYDSNNTEDVPNYFFYVCPDGLIKENEIPKYAGLYYYSDGKVKCMKGAKRIHKNKPDLVKTIKKMLRLNIQRKYLGGSMLTYLNKKVIEKNKQYDLEREKQKEIENSLFAK